MELTNILVMEITNAHQHSKGIVMVWFTEVCIQFGELIYSSFKQKTRVFGMISVSREPVQLQSSR